MKVFRSAWMKELDDETSGRIGLPSIVLMERAAHGAAEFFRREFPRSRFPNAIVVAGKGNNGGDGIAIGRMLHQRGYRVEWALLAPAARLSPDAAANLSIVRNLGLPITEIGDSEEWEEFLHRYRPGNTWLIDAIFGTGITEPIHQGATADIIRSMNGSGFPIASVDVPSGLSESFLPEEGAHIQAHITATFGGLKLALLYPDGNKHCGKIALIDIGIPRELTGHPRYNIEIIAPEAFSGLLVPRTVDGHKGDYGHVLGVVGSREKPGAGILSIYAALRAGAGLATAAIPADDRHLYIQSHPEIMTIPFKTPTALKRTLDTFDCLFAGPGLGRTGRTFKLVSLLIQNARVPLILDADALNVLEKKDSLLNTKRSYPIVLTPHPGEFSRLTGLPSERILGDRINLSLEFAARWNVFLILKGHHTVIATPGGRVYINQTGNAGMATAGSGDVLTGMIAGFVSQFYPERDMDEILQAAVFLHGYAGDRATRKNGEMSLVAGDIVSFIAESILKIHEFRSSFLIP
jgi:ADP-dependent NAD(P)H-hydrate dehydratase / NAD(P)H-hydrate epimerase